jgi:hypothetical protein
MAQLWNPKTQIRNIMGNELFWRLERLNKWVSTPIDIARSSLTGAERTISISQGGESGWKNYFQGLKEGASAGWKGVSPKSLDTWADLQQGLTFNPKGNPASKVASFFERSLRTTMHGFDYAAYNRAYKATLGEMAAVESLNKVGKIDKAFMESYLEKADTNLMDIADNYGKYVTFQDNNAASLMLMGVKRGLNKYLGTGDFGAGDLIIKYPKTPGALLMRGIEYSPAGVLKSAKTLWDGFKDVGDAKKLTPQTTREATLSLSRAITGTMGFTAIGYFLAESGALTASPNPDPDVGKFQRQQRTHPYRANLSLIGRIVSSGWDSQVVSAGPQEGDVLVSYDWMQPIALATALGANPGQKAVEKKTVAQALKSALSSSPVEAAQSVMAAADTLAEQPVLSGLVRLMGQRGAEGMANNLVNIALDIPASFTPTLLNQFRQLRDNAARETRTNDPTQTALNRMINKVPVASESLPQSYDTFGQPRELFQGEGNDAVSVFLNPTFISELRPALEEQIVKGTYEQTGSAAVFPRRVSKTINIPVTDGRRQDRVPVELTNEEYADLQKTVGTVVRKMVRQLPEVTENNAPQVEQAIYNVLQTAGTIGRMKIMPRVMKRVHPQFREQGLNIIVR